MGSAKDAEEWVPGGAADPNGSFPHLCDFALIWAMPRDAVGETEVSGSAQFCPGTESTSAPFSFCSRICAILAQYAKDIQTRLCRY